MSDEINQGSRKFNIRDYAKRHTFHMITMIAFVLFAALHFSQYALIGSVYGLTELNKISINGLDDQIIENRLTDKKEFNDIININVEWLNSKIDKEKMELNARIDILDSAIKPEKKRRMLIVKIRDAISENTRTRLTIRQLNSISVAVIDYSYQYNLPMLKILAQIKQESNFDIRARSRAGAQGLMQIMPKTMEYIELKTGKKLNPYNVNDNIFAGSFYMAEQTHEFEDYEIALKAYNWGPNNMKKYLAGELKRMPEETEMYVPYINKWIKIFTKYGIEQ